jgi:hypothetical protein
VGFLRNSAHKEQWDEDEEEEEEEDGEEEEGKRLVNFDALYVCMFCVCSYVCIV